MLIYNNIQQVCQKNGISISRLEKEAGLGNGTISGWKDSNPRLDNIQAVAKVLKVPIEKLIK